ncbi:MAG: DUF58 domain-containing protein [Myxococcales bacterium]
MSSEVRQIRVGKRAFAWLAAGLLPAVFAAPQDAALGTLAVDLLLLSLFLYDALRLRAAQLSVERELASRLRVGAPAQVRLHVQNRSGIFLRASVRDQLPETLHTSCEIHQAALPPGKRRELNAELTPTARGSLSLGRVALRLETRLGLAAVHLMAGDAQEVRALPALPLDEEAQRARREELGGMAQKLRRATQGSELESLREYVSQDPLRSIDWKATARRHRPVTRLYQPERSQTLWLVLDASRTMGQPVGEKPVLSSSHRAGPATDSTLKVLKSRFDVAVEAALALADAALHAGDQVGLMVYADSCLSLVPPAHGRRHLMRLVDALSEAQARPVHFAVRSLLTDLERHARKRSLITLFTDLENETHGSAVCEHAPMLTRRHLAVCVSLQDMHVQKRANVLPSTTAEVFHKAAAIDLLSERERLERSLEKRGVSVLEADVRGLAPKLLDHYLKVKLTARL